MVRVLRILGKSGSTGLLLFFGVLAVVCIALPFSLGKSSLGTSAEDRMTESADVTAQAVGAQLRSLTAQIQNASKDERLIEAVRTDPDGTSGAAQKAVDSLRKSNPFIGSAGFLNTDGVMVANSPDNELVGLNLGFRPYFSEPMKDPTKAFMTDPFASKLKGAPLYVSVGAAIVIPATDTEPEHTAGVLVAGLDVNASLRSYVSTFGHSEGMDVSLFDSQRNRAFGSLQSTSYDSGLLADVQRESSGFLVDKVRTSSDGKHIFAIRQVPSTNFVIAASATEESAYGVIESFQQRMYLIGGVGGTGMLLGLLLLARSLRARDRALREVRVAGDRTRVIIDTAAEAFVECDSHGTVTAWNKAAETMFGWTSAEAIGCNFHNLMTPDWRREEAEAETNKMFEDESLIGQTVRAERPVVRRGQTTPFPVSLTCWLTELDGDRRLSFFFEDITERRQLEAARELVFRRQRELVEELRRADQAKNDFMSTVSHELRTPLTSIVGYLEMLKEGYGGTFNKQGTSMVDVIDRNAHRLLHLIEDLLTLSRIESGVEKTINSLVDIRFLSMQVEQSLVPQIRERRIEMRLDVAGGLPLLQGDANQLERVLINLLTNAIKFTPEGGKVGLKAWQDGDVVRLNVTDTGMGIPAEEQKKLFTRFFRSTDAQSQQIQGTGLGLVIVKSIVERHGGKISLESEYGVGTTVSICLPVAHQTETANV